MSSNFKKISKGLLVVVSFSIFQFNLFSQYEHGWSSKISSDAHDDCRSMAMDNNHLYTVGRVENISSFIDDTTFNEFQSFGASDLFISKMTLDGEYVWVKHLGGAFNEQAVDISIGEDGHLYFCGFHEGTFDIDPNVATTLDLTFTGQRNTFIAKFTQDGDLIWGKSLNSDQVIQPNSILAVSDGVLICGKYKGQADLDPGTNSINYTSNGSHDIFVTKLDHAGQYVWSKSVGGTGNDQATNLTSDNVGNIYLIGSFQNTVEFNPGNPSSSHSSSGQGDCFLTKLNGNGQYLWSDFFGGTGNDKANYISIDSNNSLIISGYFEGTVDFNTSSSNIDEKISNGGKDTYLLKTDSNGDFLWVNTWGSITDDFGKGICLDQNNDIFHAGTFSNQLYIGSNQYTPIGMQDCLINKINNNTGLTIYTNTFGGDGEDYINHINVDSDTSLYFTGKFNADANFSPDSTHIMSNGGNFDGYILKWTLPASTAGIDEKKFNQISVYPNPSSGHFSISTNNIEYLTINILDALGNKVRTISSHKNQNVIKVNTQELSTGLYFIHFSSEKEEHTIKVQIL